MALATDTPDFMRARNATDILSQVSINLSIHFSIAKCGHLQPTDGVSRWSWVTILWCGFWVSFAVGPTIINEPIIPIFFIHQVKYKHTAEMDRASYTTVIDTPDILHAQQMKNIISQVDCPSLARIRRRVAVQNLNVVVLTEKVQRRGGEDHVPICPRSGHPWDAESPWEPEELQHRKCNGGL